MSALNFVAMWLLPLVVVTSWRHSRIVSASCAIAFLSSIAYLDTRWDPLRWIVAVLTGVMGVVALSTYVVLRHPEISPDYSPSRACANGEQVERNNVCVRNRVGRRDVLAALLIGSSCADLVSLHYEAKGHPWGALPILQIVVCVAMILISTVRRRADQEPPTVRPSALREN
jgi:hypothetical protein